VIKRIKIRVQGLVVGGGEERKSIDLQSRHSFTLELCLE